MIKMMGHGWMWIQNVKVRLRHVDRNQLIFAYPYLDQIFITKSSSTDTFHFEKISTSSDHFENISTSSEHSFIILVSSMIPFGLTLLTITTIVIIISTRMRCKFWLYIHSDVTDRFYVII